MGAVPSSDPQRLVRNLIKSGMSKEEAMIHGYKSILILSRGNPFSGRLRNEIMERIIALSGPEPRKRFEEIRNRQRREREERIAQRRWYKPWTWLV